MESLHVTHKHICFSPAFFKISLLLFICALKLVSHQHANPAQKQLISVFLHTLNEANCCLWEQHMSCTRFCQCKKQRNCPLVCAQPRLSLQPKKLKNSRDSGKKSCTLLEHTFSWAYQPWSQLFESLRDKSQLPATLGGFVKMQISSSWQF